MSSNTNLTYEGIVIFVGQTEVVSDKFSKRQIVVSDKTSEYPQEICFEFSQAKCADLDRINVNETVKIHYNLRGKLWKDNKWFNSLQGWKIELITNAVVKETPYVPLASNDTEPLPF